MSYIVRFYTFTKKSRSTLSPASGGVEYNCVVKTESGITAPTVTLTLAATARPTYNICYIPAFSRWYFVREWTFADRNWTADLIIDPLATYKAQIGAASLYVLRAASESNGHITDTQYPLLNDTTETITQGTVNQWFSVNSALTTGTFVVGIKGLVDTSQASGGITYVALSPAQFKVFTQTLFDNQLTAFITGGQLDITDTLAKMIFDPTKYIASCVWLPGSVTASSQSTGINVGYWKFSGTFNIVTPVTYMGFTQRIHIPSHGQAGTRGVYMNAPPFTNRAVHLPRFGLVDLSGILPANAADLVITLDVDPISGQGLYKLYYTETADSNTTLLLDIIQCQIGVQMPLASTTLTLQDAVTALTSGGSAILDLATFNVLGAVGDLASAFTIFSPHINDISQASGFLGYTNDPGVPYLINKYTRAADEDITENGRPLCRVRQISNLSGYVKVLHGDIAIYGATAVEMDLVRDALEEGFYYE